jgi:hypothetical protein
MQIPEQINNDQLSPLQRKAKYLRELKRVDPPSLKLTDTVPLRDDGANGDETADDGIYTGRYPDTKLDGEYSFHFRANGTTSDGIAFKREHSSKKYIPVGPDIDMTIVFVKKLKAARDRSKQYMVTVLPRDRFGNYMRPGYAGAFKLSASHGEFIDAVRDNLDGSYTQILELPAAVDEKEVRIDIAAKGVPLSVALSDKLVKDKGARFGVSVHGGLTIPLGNFNKYYDPSVYAALDLEFRITRCISVLGLVGFNNFTRQSSSKTDHWVNASIGPKYTRAIGPISAGIFAGGGIYFPEHGSNKFGFHAGLSFGYPIARHWTVELGQTYHHVFYDWDDMDFTVTHAGAIFRF